MKAVALILRESLSDTALELLLDTCKTLPGVIGIARNVGFNMEGDEKELQHVPGNFSEPVKQHVRNIWKEINETNKSKKIDKVVRFTAGKQNLHSKAQALVEKTGQTIQSKLPIPEENKIDFLIWQIEKAGFVKTSPMRSFRNGVNRFTNPATGRNYVTYKDGYVRVITSSDGKTLSMGPINSKNIMGKYIMLPTEPERLERILKLAQNYKKRCKTK